MIVRNTVIEFFVAVEDKILEGYFYKIRSWNLE